MRVSRDQGIRAPLSSQSITPDFWAESSLTQWSLSPRESFTEWLAQLRVLGVRSLRESSFETYLAMFSVWERYLREKGLGILEANSLDAQRFFEQHELEPSSRRRYLQLLDKVYHQLKLIGFKGENPLKNEFLKEGLLPEQIPPCLTLNQLKLLISTLERAKGWKGGRDRALVALTAGAGLRVNELISLRIQDIDLDWKVNVSSTGVHKSRESIVLPGKYERNQTELTTPWREWLIDWYGLKINFKVPGELVTPSTKSGGAYSRSGVFRRLKGIFAQSEISVPQNGANILRNTFARLALSSERYSAKEVQGFMGHEFARATERYSRGIDSL